MTKVLQRRSAILAVIAASLIFATTGLAQMPGVSLEKGVRRSRNRMKNSTALPSGGKLYVIGGWGGGKARGANYEYDPATDKWTKKKSMPRPAHHAALASYNGKIYVCGGFVAPEKSPVPIGAAWEPIDNVWEYDPAADSWKALAPLPDQARLRGGRGSLRQDPRDRRRHDRGRLQGSLLHVHGTLQRSEHQLRVRPRHGQVGEPQADGGAAQPRVRRCRQRQDLRDRRPHRPRLHHGRHQHRRGRGVRSRERPVECSQGADADAPKRRRLGHGRPQNLRGRR